MFLFYFFASFARRIAADANALGCALHPAREFADARDPLELVHHRRLSRFLFRREYLGLELDVVGCDFYFISKTKWRFQMQS
jgi:hypothetical protein